MPTSSATFNPVRKGKSPSSDAFEALRALDNLTPVRNEVNWRNYDGPMPVEPRLPRRPRVIKIEPKPEKPIAEKKNPLVAKADVDERLEDIKADAMERRFKVHPVERLIKAGPTMVKAALCGLVVYLGVEFTVGFKKVIRELERIGINIRANQEREALPPELQGRDQEP